MTAGRPRAAVRWGSAPAVRLHVSVVAAVVISSAAGWFEYTRARAGNQLSWAYAVEWPLIGGFCVYMWWRLLHDFTTTGDGPPGPARTRRAGAAPGPTDPPAADPELAAWQRYVAELQAADPPGGPPPRHGSTSAGQRERRRSQGGLPPGR